MTLKQLRSSVTADGDRHGGLLAVLALHRDVAILGRH